MTEWILEFGWPLLVGVVLKSLGLLAFGGLAALLLRRASASARHLVWRLTVVGLLLLPFLSAALPGWQVAVRWPAAPAPGTEMTPIRPSQNKPLAAHAPASSAPPPAPATPADPALPTEPADAPPRTIMPEVWVFGLWGVGVLIALLPTLLGLGAVARLARRCRPIPEGPISGLSRAVQPLLRVRRPIRLLLAPEDGPAVPMTWGWRRPVLLLPADAGEWPEDRLRATLLHEMAHMERADWPAQMLAQCVCALYWFHPFVWLAARRMGQEAERACDDRVLSAGVVPADYAGHLLDTVRGAKDRLMTVLPMARASGLEARLRALLTARNRRPLPPAASALLVSGLLTFAAVTAALHWDAHRPARLDGMTPARQGGFTVVAAQCGTSDFPTYQDYQSQSDTWDPNFGRDATVLWVKTPWMPKEDAAFNPVGSGRAFTVVARTSLGDSAKTNWVIKKNGVGQKLLRIDVPSGYSHDVQWIDVSVRDAAGHTAYWRLRDLPSMRHQATAATPAQAVVAGRTITAYAWHVHPRPISPESADLSVLLSLSEPLKGAGRWDISYTQARQEWLPDGAEPIISQTGEIPAPSSIPVREFLAGISSPYPQEQTRVSVSAMLNHYETLEERVTFHHVRVADFVDREPDGRAAHHRMLSVPTAQTIRTQSGIAITLPIQNRTAAEWGHLSQYASMIGGEIDRSVGSHPVILPQSPLCQRTGLPAMVTLALADPWQNVASVSNPDAPRRWNFGMMMPKMPPTVIPNLTVIVRQRVDLEQYPLHFVLPLEQGDPKALRQQRQEWAERQVQ